MVLAYLSPPWIIPLWQCILWVLHTNRYSQSYKSRPALFLSIARSSARYIRTERDAHRVDISLDFLFIVSLTLNYLKMVWTCQQCVCRVHGSLSKSANILKIVSLHKVPYWITPSILYRCVKLAQITDCGIWRLTIVEIRHISGLFWTPLNHSSIGLSCSGEAYRIIRNPET